VSEDRIDSKPDLDPVETEIVRRRAASLVRSRQLPRSEIEDARQELALAVLAARDGFDSQRGTCAAYTRTVVRRAGAKLVRARHAAKRNPARVCSLDSPAPRTALTDPAMLTAGPTHERQVDLALDVGELLARLPADLRTAAALLASLSVTEAAETLGIPRTTLHDRIRTLREEFARAGLREYLPRTSVTPSTDG
jgi:RNA polymerase sigma factor (sigma-70 family)